MKVEIKAKIAKRLKKRVEETDEFKNIGEYVNYILQQVVERLDAESADEPEENEEVYSKEDEKKVKARLRSLGYLD